MTVGTVYRQASYPNPVAANRLRLVAFSNFNEQGANRMNESLNSYPWLQYLETPRAQSQPVKLDRILAERMRAFLKARQVKPFRRVEK